jgi:hypothetical protein
METKDEYEYKNLKICKKGLQIESSCRKCLFEVLCHYEEMKEKQKEKSDLYSNNNKE